MEVVMKRAETAALEFIEESLNPYCNGSSNETTSKQDLR